MINTPWLKPLAFYISKYASIRSDGRNIYLLSVTTPLWQGTVKIYPHMKSNKFYMQKCFKIILKERIHIFKGKSVLSVSVIELFIQFTAICWNITQNSRKCRSGLWVQRWSTNWILNWNDSYKQQIDLDCSPEWENLSKWYSGMSATLKAWFLSIWKTTGQRKISWKAGTICNKIMFFLMTREDGLVFLLLPLSQPKLTTVGSFEGHRRPGRLDNPPEGNPESSEAGCSCEP